MDSNIIYLEDCMRTLLRIEDNSIDLIVTSPPYNKNAYASASGDTKSWSNLRGRQIAYDSYSDDMSPEDYEMWQKHLLEECMRVIKPTGSIFYNHKDVLVKGLCISPKWVYDFPLHQQIVWNRGSSLANDPHYFQPITEYVYWIVKDTKKFYFNKDESVFRQSVWNINFETTNPHPAPFPLLLASNIVKCASPEKGVVYDPFMGSGTTAIATLKIGGGRTYIGSEISESYKRMAEERIKTFLSELTLF